MAAAQTPATFSLETLPQYEKSLLTALAFFLGRDQNAQALACLCMYLRQSEPRIMAQLRYYAHQFSQATGQPTHEYALLDLICQSPEEVAARLQMGVVHGPDQPDVFDQGNVLEPRNRFTQENDLDPNTGFGQAGENA